MPKKVTSTPQDLLKPEVLAGLSNLELVARAAHRVQPIDPMIVIGIAHAIEQDFDIRFKRLHALCRRGV